MNEKAAGSTAASKFFVFIFCGGIDARTNTCYNIDRKRGGNVKQSELLKLFSKNNIKFLQHGKRHDIYYSPITGRKFPVPRHTKEIAEGTLKSIKKDAGLE